MRQVAESACTLPGEPEHGQKGKEREKTTQLASMVSDLQNGVRRLLGTIPVSEIQVVIRYDAENRRDWKAEGGCDTPRRDDARQEQGRKKTRRQFCEYMRRHSVRVPKNSRVGFTGNLGQGNSQLVSRAALCTSPTHHLHILRHEQAPSLQTSFPCPYLSALHLHRCGLIASARCAVGTQSTPS